MNAGLPMSVLHHRRSSAATSPARSESFMLPTFISRFRAIESSHSNLGLNSFTLIRNDMLITAIIKNARMMPADVNFGAYRLQSLECTLE